MNKIFSIFLILTFLLNYVIRLSANDDTYINSSNIIYNEKQNIVELAENSKINYKDTNILIDRGIIDYNKNEIEIFGNFYLYQDLNILSGENLKGNTSLDIFTANNVSFIYNDDLKIDSDNIRKENNVLYFYNNFLTPCELEGYFNCPTWSLRIDKTKYEIKQDKFTHFDTFLQIADYKVLYVPYFSHYGSKAPRKKGFLTPSFEFNLGGDVGLVSPYYLPLNESTELIFKPTIYFNDNFKFLNSFEINTLLNKKSSAGNTEVEVNNIKKDNLPDISSSLKFNTKNVLDKNKIISAGGLFTNNISTIRSINEEPITFEDIYLRLENYNFLHQDDYLKTELTSIESFESSEANIIPISSSINYINKTNLNKNDLINEINLLILKRDESNTINPSESTKLSLKNELVLNSFSQNSISYSKLKISNSFNNYHFNQNSSLDKQSVKSVIYLSKEVFYKFNENITPRIKFVLPMQILNSEKTINEDSNSLTYNYNSQFSDNRYFGNDLIDNTPRIIYGIENKFMTNHNSLFSIKINQSYDLNNNNRFANELNQTSKFSDYALEAKVNYKNIIFTFDSRLDEKNLSKKEMNYNLNIIDPIDLSLNYHETQSEAFKNLSNDTQSLDFIFSKKIYENFSASYVANLDVKNNYDPYKSSLNLSIFDECSQFDIIYSNTRFNDNFNTKPEEKISLSFSMDYLGFFKYENQTNLIDNDI